MFITITNPFQGLIVVLGWIFLTFIVIGVIAYFVDENEKKENARISERVEEREREMNIFRNNCELLFKERSLALASRKAKAMKTGEVIAKLQAGVRLTDGDYVYKINKYGNIARCEIGTNDWEKIDFSDLSDGMPLEVYVKDPVLKMKKSELKTQFETYISNIGAYQKPTFDGFAARLNI